MPSRLRSLAGIVAVVQAAGAQSHPARPVSSVVGHVDRFTVEHGLAENAVRAIVQDRTGFIWVLSRGGVLQRYDGVAFVDFKSLARGPADVVMPPVRSLMLDDDGFPWVSTDRELFRIDASHRPDRRIALAAPVCASATDGRGRLRIISAGRLHVVDTRATKPGLSSVADERRWLCAMARGPQDRLWLAHRTSSRVAVTMLGTTAVDASYELPAIGLLEGMRSDSANRLWVAGDQGLAVLDPGATVLRTVPAFSGKFVTSPSPDARGRLVVATDDSAARFGRDGNVDEWITSTDVFGRNALPTATLTDREGGIWLATTTNGLLRLHTEPPVFEHYSTRSAPFASDFIMAVHEQRDGALWLGTLRGGAHRVSPDWRQVNRLPEPPGSGRMSNDVWDFEEDADGNLWMATSEGICRVSGAVPRCHAVEGGVVDIARDGDGWFWLAKYLRGLQGFNPRTAQFVSASVGVDSGSTAYPIVSLLVEPDSGIMWIGAGRTIVRAHVHGGRLTRDATQFPAPTEPNDLVYQLHRDRRGVLYAGAGAGLLQLRSDSGRDRFERVLLPGLPSSTIFSIAEDERGSLWLGSAHGLIHYSAERRYARRFGRRDNFFSGELNRRAALRRRDGSLVFGGIEGATQFDPRAVTGSGNPVPIVLTRWNRLTSDGPVDASIIGSPQLVLGPHDRAFTIQFAALSYAPHPGRRYRYRIGGLNPSWVETTDPSATYAAPPPGRYVMEIQTSMGGGSEWSSAGTTVILDVIPPFWKTTWFRLGLLTAAALLMWLLHRWRLRQAVVTERLRLRISRDLHDEIGAGLSSIALLSDRGAGDESTAPADRLILRRIGESARSMVADLRDIVWAIDPEGDRARNVVARMQDVASGLLRDVKIVYDLPSPEASSHIGMTERRDLLLLYKEILHNVARHARATEVRIALAIHRGTIELTVSDDGVGFTPSTTQSGTGLKSLQERAERLGGELHIDTAPGRGTTMRLSIEGRERVVRTAPAQRRLKRFFTRSR